MVSKPLNTLARFETLAERWLEGGFARLFRTRFHQAELLEYLIRTLEDSRSSGLNGIWVAPEKYHVLLHPDDYARLGDRHNLQELEQTLTGSVMAAAQQLGATLTRRPEVRIIPSARIRPRQMQVHTQPNTPQDLAELPLDTQEFDAGQAWGNAGQAQALRHCLLIGSQCFPVDTPIVSVGRGLDNDLVLEYPRISRHHAQLRLREGHWWLVDLDSANGTTVNGQPVSEATLLPGDTISLAGVEIRFELQTPLNEQPSLHP